MLEPLKAIVHDSIKAWNRMQHPSYPDSVPPELRAEDAVLISMVKCSPYEYMPHGNSANTAKTLVRLKALSQWHTPSVGQLCGMVLACKGRRYEGTQIRAVTQTSLFPMQ
jgi:hypothetical protein